MGHMEAEIDVGVFVGSAVLPITSKSARYGVRDVLSVVTPDGEIAVTIRLRRGLAGWWTRRWIRAHPPRLTVTVYRPEWGEWRKQDGIVRIGKADFRTLSGSKPSDVDCA